MPRIAIALVPVLSLVIACAEGPGGPGPDFPEGFSVQTDSVAYTLTHRPGIYDATAHVTYVNHTGGPIWYSRCTSRDTVPRYGIARVYEQSTDPTLVGETDCAGDEPVIPRLIIPDGSSHTFRVSLASGDEPDARPPVTLNQRTGNFRVTFAVCTRAERGPDQCFAALSNAFEVRAPQ